MGSAKTSTNLSVDGVDRWCRSRKRTTCVEKNFLLSSNRRARHANVDVADGAVVIDGRGAGRGDINVGGKFLGRKILHAGIGAAYLYRDILFLRQGPHALVHVAIVLAALVEQGELLVAMCDNGDRYIGKAFAQAVRIACDGGDGPTQRIAITGNNFKFNRIVVLMI